MRVLVGLILISAMLGTAFDTAQAEAPFFSKRPKARDLSSLTAAHAPKIRVSYHASVRPKARKRSKGFEVLETSFQDAPQSSVKTYALASSRPVYRSPRPWARPDGLDIITPSKPLDKAVVEPFTLKPRKPKNTTKKPTRVASATPFVTSAKGALCGDPKIKGEVLSPIAGTLPGCGLANPVKVASVDGVILSQGSIMDCQTAKALRGWVSNSLIPAVRYRGGGVKSLRVPSHYSCRTRSSQPGAKISEHGKGHAIDISSIRLHNGSEITVLKGWKNPRDKRVLVKLHQAACGPFGTVLGPGSDRFHQDHFHFDTARYRGGPYCR